MSLLVYASYVYVFVIVLSHPQEALYENEKIGIEAFRGRKMFEMTHPALIIDLAAALSVLAVSLCLWSS